MSKATKAKSPYQEMLQRGIDGYMAEKQPDSVTTTKPASTTPGDATPPLSCSRKNKNKNDNNDYESEEEETEAERQKRIEEEAAEEKEAWDNRHKFLNEEEKKMNEEDD